MFFVITRQQWTEGPRHYAQILICWREEETVAVSGYLQRGEDKGMQVISLVRKTYEEAKYRRAQTCPRSQYNSSRSRCLSTEANFPGSIMLDKNLRPLWPQ